MSELEEETGSARNVESQAFLSLVSTVPWLLKQYFADSVNLLQTEGRLALRSLVMIAALTLCFSGLIAGTWLVLIALAVYTAAEGGVPTWGIALGVIVLHLLAFVALAVQMKILSRYLFFPHSRRALGMLASRDQTGQ